MHNVVDFAIINIHIDTSMDSEIDKFELKDYKEENFDKSKNCELLHNHTYY